MAVGWGLGGAVGGSSLQVFKEPFHALFGDLIFSFLGHFFLFAQTFYNVDNSLRYKKNK